MPKNLVTLTRQLIRKQPMFSLNKEGRPRKVLVYFFNDAIMGMGEEDELRAVVSCVWAWGMNASIVWGGVRLSALFSACAMEAIVRKDWSGRRRTKRLPSLQLFPMPLATVKPL